MLDTLLPHLDSVSPTYIISVVRKDIRSKFVVAPVYTHTVLTAIFHVNLG